MMMVVRALPGMAEGPMSQCQYSGYQLPWQGDHMRFTSRRMEEQVLVVQNVIACFSDACLSLKPF